MSKTSFILLIPFVILINMPGYSNILKDDERKTSPSKSFIEFIGLTANASLQNDYSRLLQYYLISKIKNKTSEYKYNDPAIKFISDNILMLFTRTYRNGSRFVYLDKSMIKKLDDYQTQSQLYEDKISNELELAKKLTRNWFYNISAKIFNTIAQAFTQIITGNIHTILQVVFEAGYNFYDSLRYSESDGQKLQLYETFKLKYPDSERIKNKADKIENLKNKKLKSLVRLYLKRSKFFKENREYNFASYYIGKAEEVGIEYKNKKTESRKLKIAKEESEEKRDIIASLDFIYPTIDSNLNPSEKNAYKAILDNLLIANPDQIIKSCNDFKENFPGSKLFYEAEFAKIVSYINNDEKKLAAEKLKYIKKKSDSDLLSERAKAHLLIPSMNPAEEFQRLKNKRRKDLFIYCLTGYRSTEEGAKITISALLGSPEAFAQTVGSFLVIEIFVRTLILPWANPISDSKIVDSAKVALAANPENEEKKSLTTFLYKRYKKRKEYDKVIEYLAMTNFHSEHKERKFRKKWAKQEIALGDDMKNAFNKINHYKKAAEIYPNSKLTDKVKKDIGKIEKTINVIFWINKDMLLKYKNELTEKYFDIPSFMIDKKKRNGEIDKNGVGIKNNNTIVYYNMKLKDYEIKQLDINKKDKERFNAFTASVKKEEELNYSIDEITKKQYFPLEIEGSFGEAGLVAYPQMQTDE